MIVWGSKRATSDARHAGRMWLIYVGLPCLALLLIAAVATIAEARGGPADVTAANAPRVCFPAGKWGPVPERYAPCVKVTRLYEDGSFQFAVSDRDGTVRYSSGVGALDR